MCTEEQNRPHEDISNSDRSLPHAIHNRRHLRSGTVHPNTARRTSRIVVVILPEKIHNNTAVVEKTNIVVIVVSILGGTATNVLRRQNQNNQRIVAGDRVGRRSRDRFRVGQGFDVACRTSLERGAETVRTESACVVSRNGEKGSRGGGTTATPTIDGDQRRGRSRGGVRNRTIRGGVRGRRQRRDRRDVGSKLRCLVTFQGGGGYLLRQ